MAEPINVKISNYYIAGDKEAIHDIEEHFTGRGLSVNYMLLFALDAQMKNLQDGKTIDDTIYNLIDEDHLDPTFMGRIIDNNPEIKSALESNANALKVIAAYQVWHEINSESIGHKTINAIKDKIHSVYGLEIPVDIVDMQLSTRLKGVEQEK